MITLDSDLHTHTTFNSDRCSIPEAMAQSALQLGLQAIPFTEHAEWHDGREGFENLADYLDVVIQI